MGRDWLEIKCERLYQNNSWIWHIKMIIDRDGNYNNGVWLIFSIVPRKKLKLLYIFVLRLFNMFLCRTRYAV